VLTRHALDAPRAATGRATYVRGRTDRPSWRTRPRTEVARRIWEPTLNLIELSEFMRKRRKAVGAVAPVTVYCSLPPARRSTSTSPTPTVPTPGAPLNRVTVLFEDRPSSLTVQGRQRPEPSARRWVDIQTNGDVLLLGAWAGNRHRRATERAPQCSDYKRRDRCCSRSTSTGARRLAHLELDRSRHGCRSRSVNHDDAVHGAARLPRVASFVPNRLDR